MKKTLLILLLFISEIGFLNATEYEYVPLVREGAEWSYKVTTRWTDITKGYYRIRFYGETTNNGKTYLKAYRYNGCDFDPKTATFTALMREENKKVYMVPVEFGEYDVTGMEDSYKQGTEYLIYDFGLNVGERTPRGIGGNKDGNVISEIKYIEIDGKLRKEFISDSAPIMTEGLGSPTDGDLIYPFQMSPSGGGVNVSNTCERNLDTKAIVYKSAIYDSNDNCTNSIETINTSTNISITQSSDGKIDIALEQGILQSVEIIALNGMVATKKILNEGTQASIYTNKLASGTYIIVTNTSLGSESRKIIIK